jgi:hypothetical protein
MSVCSTPESFHLNNRHRGNLKSHNEFGYSENVPSDVGTCETSRATLEPAKHPERRWNLRNVPSDIGTCETSRATLEPVKRPERRWNLRNVPSDVGTCETSRATLEPAKPPERRWNLRNVPSDVGTRETSRATLEPASTPYPSRTQCQAPWCRPEFVPLRHSYARRS